MRRRVQLAAAAPAVGRRQRGRARRAGDRRRPRPAGRRRAPPGPPRGLRPVRLQAAGLDAAVGDPEVAPAVHRRRVAVPAPRSGRHEPLRGRRLRPQQRRRRLPEPDVPLPAARHPLRRLGAGRRPRLPGPRRADVLRRPRLGEDRLDRPGRPPGAALQLPLHGPGPARVGRGDPGRPADPEPAGVRAVQRRRDVARPGGRDRRADPRLGRPGRRDGAPPVVHLPGWAPTTTRWSTR